MTTKPYPLFRMPGILNAVNFEINWLTESGWHKTSIAYTSDGHRRYNQPFTPTNYGPEYVQGDVIGVGYRPRTGTVFFTRNGKKLDDVAHGLKTQNFFPTAGANGPCNVHVNFGQSGFVFIEANVKKWGLAPLTGSLAPPPPYGSEQGSILLEAGGNEAQQIQNSYPGPRHGRSRSRFGPMVGNPTSPGPVRSPTDISLAQLVHIPSHEDVGEGTSRNIETAPQGLGIEQAQPDMPQQNLAPGQVYNIPPPEYTSPTQSEHTPSESSGSSTARPLSPRPPIPSYEVAIAQGPQMDVASEISEAVEESQNRRIR